MNQGFLGGVPRDLARAGAGLFTALLLTVSLVLATATPASAEPQALAIHGYQQDFGVSEPVAEENLETQEEGAGIVEQLEETQGNHYAGVWFDNETGEFVIPTVDGAGQASVAGALKGADLEGDFHTKAVQYSWDELEAAQGRIDEALMPLIEESLVQTSLDPRANAVVISEADGVGKADDDRIAEQASGEHVNVVVRDSSLQQFQVGVKACRTTTPRACGRPLRGGVSLTPTCQNCTYAVGECSAGFKATGGGNRYMLTAGHCAAKFAHWGSEDAGGTWHDIGLVEQYSFPTHDWAKIKANGSQYWDWNPWPTEVAHYWEDQERQITAESDSYMGEYVCHSGNKTGTSCGNVGELNQTVTDDFSGNVIEHEVEFNNVCSIGGDSGGAVFAGNTALGLYSASTFESYPGACDAIAYYVEITEATDALGVSVAPRVALPPGGQVAFQANSTQLFSYSYAMGSATTGLGMAAGTSPSVLMFTNGKYMMALQANTKTLWISSPASGSGNTFLGMAAGTSPSATWLPEKNGNQEEYEVVFQANDGNLWVRSSTGAFGNTGFGMKPGTSPSITTLPNGEWEVAFQANDGNLWVRSSSGAFGNTGFGMKPGTSPSITTLPSGEWETAFQTNGTQLWIRSSSGAYENTGLGMAAGTSPSVSSPSRWLH